MTFVVGHTPWNAGKRLSENHKRRLSEALRGKKPKNLKEIHSLGGKATIGKKNGVWKGDDVGYRALHHWVVRHLGTPDTCENCGANGLSGHEIHWANKSGEYKREKSDWIRLCGKCHSDYDRKGVD